MPVLRSRTGNPDAPQQHSQPSRKGKKAWRKNVDVTEVQQGLEDLNAEIIHGGVIAEKDSADIFVLDTNGCPDNSKKVRRVKGLQADDIIASRSVVPAIVSRKRQGDRTTDGILPVKRQRTSYVTHKELARIRKVADGFHESTVEVADATYDPWAVATTPTSGPLTEPDTHGWLPGPIKPKAPSTLARAPVSLAANGKVVPAVPKPAAAYSYNPVATDYINRLEKEGEKAVQAERRRLDAAQAERQRLQAAAQSAAEAEAAEARADLSEWDEDSAWEGINTEDEAVVGQKRPKRKTPAQRNKTKRRKEEERRKKHEAAMRRKDEQAKHIKELVDLVEARQQELALVQVDVSDGDSEGNDEELRRRQLGRFRLPEKDLELVLPDELQESLRLLKPEGNLIKDRYRNLLVRGKLEARRKIPFRKQAKVKFTEKWTHKDFDVSRL